MGDLIMQSNYVEVRTTGHNNASGPRSGRITVITMTKIYSYSPNLSVFSCVIVAVVMSW